MPSRRALPIPHPLRKGILGLRHSDTETVELDVHSPTNAPSRTLSPVSATAMNTIRLLPTSEDTPAMSDSTANTSKSMADSLDGSGGSRNTEEEELSALPSPTTKSYGALQTSQSTPTLTPNTRTIAAPSNGAVRTISTEFGASRSHPTFPIAEDNTAGITSPTSVQWSSAVGRANLGKSGRVIERLMGENDMLKREVKIERLRAEESKQAMKMTEARMETLTADYDGRLNEAAINKALLKRRERHLSELKSQIDGERSRAEAAVNSERVWREAMEQMEVETRRKVDDATNYAILMESRNKILSSHWKEQGEMVSNTVSKLNVEISALVQDRRADILRMDYLEVICNQKNDALIRLEAEKQQIADLFDAYRLEQESLLAGIKARALQQEQAHEEALMETQKVLGELKWALGVKTNVKDAH